MDISLNVPVAVATVLFPVSVRTHKVISWAGRCRYFKYKVEEKNVITLYQFSLVGSFPLTVVITETRLSLSLSFTASRHLRPSSGREHTGITCR